MHISYSGATAAARASDAHNQASGTRTAGIIYIVFAVISVLFWFKGCKQVSRFKAAEAQAATSSALSQ